MKYIVARGPQTSLEKQHKSNLQLDMFHGLKTGKKSKQQGEEEDKKCVSTILELGEIFLQ